MKPSHIPLPPPSFPQGGHSRANLFNTQDPALETPELASPPLFTHPPRVSFSRRQHRPSHATGNSLRFQRTRTLDSEFEVSSPSLKERPSIPSALPGVDTTPLPKISMIVLSICMLGEFLSANVSTPFLLFMVEGFGVGHGDEAAVGYWTGILVSVFFITQFITSLLWATVANKNGVRTVLFISLLGNALTCFLFGTSTSLNQAIAIRLAQGVFNGAIGVARGSVASIMDGSNEGRAYAIMGFSWGMGGVAGAILGGALESPAKKWPNTFKSGIFVTFPYLLPCAVAASIISVGAFLSLFLARDGGPREGAIRLPPEKDATVGPPIHLGSSDDPAVFEEEERPSGPVVTAVKGMRKQLSGYFARRVREAHQSTTSPLPSPTARQPASPGRRTFSGTSRINGSAYGYGNNRSRFGSRSTVTGFRGPRPSFASTSQRRGDEEAGNQDGGRVEDMNFAQRLLMANEFTATSLTNLWVAAAINADNEDPFLSDSEQDEYIVEDLEDEHEAQSSSRPTNLSPQFPPRPRRFSSASHLPAIYSNTGVQTPPSLEQYPTISSDPFSDGPINSLEPIIEGQASVPTAPLVIVEKPKSGWMQLPLVIIFQYFVLALHNTTHDQVFYSYLVSKYRSGGLGLDAGHFAQLIALMCLAQISYQFYLYPNIGPPRGRFSHLAMFRIGSALYIPSYLSVILYRAFASSEGGGGFIVMALLAVSTAIRYCGSTFSYTSVAILLNYMSPPHLVSISNGLAQSTVSLARFVGPVLGGYLWSVSVQDNPNGYPLGFYVCTLVCAAAILHSFVIR